MKKNVTLAVVLLTVAALVGAAPAEARTISVVEEGGVSYVTVTCDGGQTGTGTMFQPTPAELSAAADQFCGSFAP